MLHLLNLLAAIAMLVWGTYLVRTGILRVFGGSLRAVIAHGVSTRWAAAASGLAVTALVQSSTATAMIVSSFVARGLVALPMALAVMLGADVGTSLVAVVFSLDVSWLSPLLILVGVVLFLSRPAQSTGRIGRVLIGLGLMLLALKLVSASTLVMAQSGAVKLMLGTLSNDVLLAITMGVALAVMAFSSLAVVLLASAMVSSSLLPLETALGVVLGANLGSGLLAVLVTAKAEMAARHVPLGNLLFKGLGVLMVTPAIGLWLAHVQPHLGHAASAVVLFHLGFNGLVALLFLGAIDVAARCVQRAFPTSRVPAESARAHLLDPSALTTPSLAITSATREAIHQADVVETMMLGMLRVIKDNDLQLAGELRKMEDTVDRLYSEIKHYLTKISREALNEEESRRWSDIISFTINTEQVGDIIERILLDIEEKKIKAGRTFSDAGMAEICELHAHLLNNLRLGTGVFLHGSVQDAQKLLEEKARFRDRVRACASTHLSRLSANTVQSLETSSLHLDLISDLKQINSHVCSIAYPILAARLVR